MSLSNKTFRINQGKKHQAGAVLVTGLLFMLIVSMACFTSLENIRVFRVNDSEQIKAYSEFYQAGALLDALENHLLQTSIHVNAMNAFFEEQQLVDNSDKNFSDDVAERWHHNRAAIREQDGAQYLQEFLGFRKKTFLNSETNELQEVVLCIIRISVWQKGQPQYAIQGWLTLVPEESRVQLEHHGLDVASRRIAWLD